MSNHVFVAMPYGVKQEIDFNRIYLEYIKPALESAGFDVFRADEELRAGNIRGDFFQELLLADLVVVDLSIDNPNVWYELGVRHALRARGVIQIQCLRDYLPFDVYTDRTLRYHIKDGAPDPAFLEADKKALVEFANETVKSWYGRKISPVYYYLRSLQEPDWKSLKIEEAKEFWDAQGKWRDRVDLARKHKKAGDILVLAEEAPIRALRLESLRTAGIALMKMGKYPFALEQFNKALEIDPTDLESRRKKGIVLGRLEKHEEAKIWLKNLVEDHPDDAESRGLLGRVEKDAWINEWRQPDNSLEDKKREALRAIAYLNEALSSYLQGFLKNPSNYYPGINAVCLMHLAKHLQKNGRHVRTDKVLEDGVRWAINSTLHIQPDDEERYWALVTLGDLEVLTGDQASVEEAYRAAISKADKNWFNLDSTRQQLLILKDLGFRPDVVEPALAIFDRELEKINEPEKKYEPRNVLLFSGHMIDATDRAEPRFPPEKESIAAQAITNKLNEFCANAEDLALCGGACGGDLLFAEACLQRGVRVELHIPFEEPQSIQESVEFAEAEWVDRYYKVRKHPNTTLLIMPRELGPLPKGRDPFERNNLWLLYTALAHGSEKIKFLCLWNRKGGDGPGGTQHLHDTVLQHNGQVYILDTTTLW